MKRFRTIIITKTKLKRAALAGMAVLAAAGAWFGIKTSAPKAVPAFSDESGEIARSILDKGVPNADEQISIRELASSLLGFDTADPVSIIQGSAGYFTTPAPTAAPTPPIAAPAAPSAAPEQPTERQLPSHEQLAAAPLPETKNATDYAVDIGALLAAPSETVLAMSGEPEVLVMHTHTTECYVGDEMKGESERTTNESYNVCAVGDVLCATLEGYGIHTVHDKTIHDYPTYQGSYSRALNTINADMEKYPSVKVVIDLHRDAYVYPDGTKLRVAADINGGECAQAMLVIGTDSMGLYHPYWRSNLALAARIQSAADIMYPNLMRPIDLRRERFNMHVTRGSLLIEIGSNGNTLDEAKTAAAYLGDAIAAALMSG